MKRKILSYSDIELAWIKANCQLTRREAFDQFCKKFSRDDVSLANYVGLCKRNGWLTGRTGQIEPGSVSWNKGKKMPFNPGTARTQFKKGHTPANTKFAGHERSHEDGYLYISIDETNPHTGFKRRYVLKHKHLWEQKNGKLPGGMVLKCLDGNRQNCDPDNWEAVPRGVVPYLNGRWDGRKYDEAAPEVKPVLLTIAKIKYKKKTLKEDKNV
jgi:HNH endonuclease